VEIAHGGFAGSVEGKEANAGSDPDKTDRKEDHPASRLKDFTKLAWLVVRGIGSRGIFKAFHKRKGVFCWRFFFLYREYIVKIVI